MSTLEYMGFKSQISSCFSLVRPLGLCELLKHISTDHDSSIAAPRGAEHACSGKRSWPCLVLFVLFSLSECNYICAIPLLREGSAVHVLALKDCPVSLIILPQPATEDMSIDKEGISGLCGHMSPQSAALTVNAFNKPKDLVQTCNLTLLTLQTTKYFNGAC